MRLRVRFGEWTFDGESRELRGLKGVAHLSPKAFELLGVLLESRPRACSKAELHDRLWAKTFVSDSNLARLVKEIRKALGDPVRRPAFLRTVHAYGYAFCGEAVELARAGSPAGRDPTCCLICGPRQHPLAEGENILGRASEAWAWADASTVSRRHARILLSGEEATIEDLGSKNGTYLHGKRLGSPAALADGDEIRLGSIPMTFRVLFTSDSTDTYAARSGDA